jgi:hypothetical protein
MAPKKETNRHLPGAYVLAALELLFGVLLALAAMSFAPVLFRQPRANLDDYLALAGMAVPGVAVTVAGAATLLHSRLAYALLRRVQMVAMASEVAMILAGAGMWAVARHRGGDWAGVGILGDFIFIALGTLLLLLSLFGLRYLRRLRPDIT